MFADAFFGASPVVASALGFRSGATPHGRVQSNISFLGKPLKTELSIWHEIGTFYLALTGKTFGSFGSRAQYRGDGAFLTAN